MNQQTRRNEGKCCPRKSLCWPSGAAALAVACGLLCFASPLPAQDNPEKDAKGSKGAGIYFDAEASAKDVGLPIYPGARPHKEKDNGSDSVKMGLWGSSFAFKLAVVKLESNDSPQKVAAFYKKALGRYGKVLDCGAPSSQTDDKDESSNKLTCEDDKPDPGNMTFKAGTKEKQHVVGIEPNGSGSVFSLVYVESPDSDKKKVIIRGMPLVGPIFTYDLTSSPSHDVSR
ncbi:MAG TPA: hypothetical protein VJN89_04905 [Candidatus Acidoferrum sp.]|nr:hypothetical protein [Candidatus Acidoferrum sp.]